MRKRLLFCSILVFLTSILSYFSFKLLENRAVPFDFGRKIQKSYELIDVVANEGYGKILNVSNDSIVFLDKNYQYYEIKKIGGGNTKGQSDKNSNNEPYFFLGGGGVTNVGVYSFCGNCSQIFFNGKGGRKSFKLTTTFTHAVLIDSQTVILRNGNLDYEFVLGKYNFKSHKVQWSNMNTKTRNNGGLATDGSLVYDGEKFLYFVNRYNSSILKFDTNLKTHSVFHTIDAVKSLPAVVYIEKSKSYHFSGIRNAINESVAVRGNILYVKSTAKGKNDTLSFASYIDAYDTHTGKYLFSYSISRELGSILDIYVDKDGLLYILTSISLKLINSK